MPQLPASFACQYLYPDKIILVFHIFLACVSFPDVFIVFPVLELLDLPATSVFGQAL
ncbi:hypothetical protein D1872_333240 [compost metagenome]